jgi:hypothetical protein
LSGFKKGDIPIDQAIKALSATKEFRDFWQWVGADEFLEEKIGGLLNDTTGKKNDS